MSIYRFYSNAVLDYVHRAKAVAEWYKLSKGEDVALERALGSFDMFVIHDQHGDLQEVSTPRIPAERSG